MALLRVVEVFPPLFPISPKEHGSIGLEEKTERFVEGVRSIRELADVFLVASVKNPQLLKLSTIEAARLLRDRLRVEAAPVIVVRDMNRLQFLSSVLTGISLDFEWMMIAWGDNYSVSAGASNVRDFSSLSEAIREAGSIRSRARASTRFFAPVDMDLLGQEKGDALAKSRLRAGADYLLAQPPSFDSETLDRHVSRLEKSGIKDKVLLNVFPFKDSKDLDYCQRYFGWKFPKHFRELAASGEPALFEEERNVVRRLRKEGFPGLYVSTRGNPSIARSLFS
ncbi:MAG: methylenetetrahydrofolate reductase [Thaumarchaeota archaeon]|nr:methylenetetrahydrofolate reductase [Nitrososphaerota archaeon]